MATQHEVKEEKEKDVKEVKGFSGSPHEGKKEPVRPKGASDKATIDYIGATEPTKVYKGDGVTPFEE